MTAANGIRRIYISFGESERSASNRHSPIAMRLNSRTGIANNYWSLETGDRKLALVAICTLAIGVDRRRHLKDPRVEGHAKCQMPFKIQTQR